jgi:hypothetical protein
VFTNPRGNDPRARRVAGVDMTYGRIIGGGLYTDDDRQIVLRLRDPNPRVCRQVTDRVNEVFGESSIPMARGRYDYNVEFKVPPRWEADLDHFLELMLHLPMTTNSSAIELRAKLLCEKIAGRRILGPEAEADAQAAAATGDKAGGADAASSRAAGRGRSAGPRGADVGEGFGLERLSLAAEACGRPSLKYLKPLLADRTLPDARRLAAAETAVRLGDSEAAETLREFAFGDKLSKDTPAEDRSAWQERAVHTLAYAPDAPARAGAVLQDVMRRHPSPRLRVLAYEGLRRRGDRSIRTTRIVQRLDQRGEARAWFELDIVGKDPSAPALVYATQREQARIVLFGPDVPVELPEPYLSPETIKGLPRLVLSQEKPDGAPGGATGGAGGGAGDRVSAGGSLGNAPPRKSKLGRLSIDLQTRTGNKAPTLHAEPNLIDLVKVLGGTPPDTPREDDFGLGMAYSEIVGVLYDLTWRQEGKLPAADALFELQPPTAPLPELVVRKARRNEEAPPPDSPEAAGGQDNTDADAPAKPSPSKPDASGKRPRPSADNDGDGDAPDRPTRPVRGSPEDPDLPPAARPKRR